MEDKYVYTYEEWYERQLERTYNRIEYGCLICTIIIGMAFFARIVL